jgi:DNA-binding response OmpR family regulator
MARRERRDVSRQPLILIVDDNPDILFLLRTSLRAAGFDTEEALNGRIALERIAYRKPDLVLLDLMMPILDGWGVLEALGDRADRPPVIVVSALEAKASKDRAANYSVAGYVTKPFNFKQLVSAVRKVVESTEFPEPGEPSEPAAV